MPGQFRVGQAIRSPAQATTRVIYPGTFVGSGGTMQPPTGNNPLNKATSATRLGRPQVQAHLDADRATPQQIVRAIVDILAAILRMVRPASTNLLNGGALFQSVQFTGNSVTLFHSLGRPWTGYFLTRSSVVGVTIHDVANPSGLDRSVALTLASPSTATGDVLVF